MLHALSTVTGLFDEQLEGWQAHSGGLIQCLEFGLSDPDRGFARGALWELGSAGGPMKAVFAPRGHGVWGTDHHRHVRQHLGRSAQWAILGEDLPEESNRVELSTTQFDSSGLPAPKIAYRVSANTSALTDWNIERATESLEAAGAWKVDSLRRLANGHFMGTARMGDDSSTSVVDRWCVSHDIANLLIVDGSVFVTSGAANPTSTIAALALRAADRLIERRAEIPRPRRSVSFGLSQRPRRAIESPPSTTVYVAQTLGADLRQRFERLADAVIPAGDGMPAPSDLGIGSALLDRVLRVRPDLAEPLRALLGRAADEPDRALATIDDDPLTARTLRYVVAAAYYLSDDVRTRLGYPGTVARPVGRFDYPEYMTEGLIDHLVTDVA